jgi:hypothetical protein
LAKCEQLARLRIFASLDQRFQDGVDSRQRIRQTDFSSAVWKAQSNLIYVVVQIARHIIWREYGLRATENGAIFDYAPQIPR